MFSKSRPDNDFEYAQCPVCRALLGQRDKTTVFQAHCAECRATYYWKPWSERPSVIMDSVKPPQRYCGPKGCVCRG